MDQNNVAWARRLAQTPLPLAPEGTKTLAALVVEQQDAIAYLERTVKDIAHLRNEDAREHLEAFRALKQSILDALGHECDS